MKRRGQMKLSFGMIFSIILIIVFIAFAVYGITKFLDLQKNVQEKTFITNLQTDVDKLWKARLGSIPAEYVLPKNVDSVCFDNEGGDNLELTKDQGYTSYEIEHIEIKQRICVDKVEGKVKIILKKEFGDNLVTITE